MQVRDADGGAGSNNSSPSPILQGIGITVGVIAQGIPVLATLVGAPWWLRLVLGAATVAALGAVTRSLWWHSKRRRLSVLSVALVVLTGAAIGSAIIPSEAQSRAPVGRASITSPGDGQALTLRTNGGPDGFTDGFVASGTCEIPPGYAALVVVKAAAGGYYTLSGILELCTDDGKLHYWTAERIDPSWNGILPGTEVTIGVVIARKDVAEEAAVTPKRVLTLPRELAASVRVRITRLVVSGSSTPR